MANFTNILTTYRPLFESVKHLQCDQMAVVFVLYLAILNFLICPIGSIFRQSRFYILPNTK